jgi:4-amino-4-deoxy-L-arabinose transferase-like glycosyltransferase
MAISVVWPALLFVLSFVTRAFNFGMVPAGMNQDEAMGAYDAYALLLTGADHWGVKWPIHLTGWGYGQMSALPSYLMIPFIKVFGLNSFSARLPALLVSMAGLWALYVYVKHTFGKTAGTITLAVGAVNPWHIMQSRWALDCNFFPHFLMLGVCLMALGLEKGKKSAVWLLCGSMLCFALSMYCYGIAFYTVPVLLAAAAVYLLATRNIKPGRLLLCATVYAAFAWPIFALMVINYFRWPSIVTPLFTIPYFPDSVRINDILLFSSDIPAQLKANLAALYKTVILQTDGLPWNAIGAFGTMYKFALPFSALGLIYSLGKRTPKSALLKIWLAVSIFAGLMTNVNINRINIICYPLIIFSGIGIYGTVIWLGQKLHTYVKRTAAAVVIALYAVSFAAFVSQYYGPYNSQVARYFYPGFIQSVRYAQGMGEKLYVTRYTQAPQAYYMVSEILTLFAGPVDPAYIHTPEYSQQYSYVVFEAQPTDTNAVYVLNADELNYFPPDQFKLTQFGGYYVAEPTDG